MIVRPHEVDLVDTWKADSQSRSMARARNYPMCQHTWREAGFSEDTAGIVQARLCPDRCDERLDAHNIHHAGNVVGQHV